MLFESLVLETDDAAVSLRWEDPTYRGTIDPNYKEVEITATAVDGSDDNSDKTTAFADDVRKRENDDTFTLYPQAEDSTGHEPADTTYAYESDDTAVLTVDSHGEVTIAGTGTAIITITASNADYYNVTDTVAITIEAILEYTTVETYTDNAHATAFDDATHGARTIW